MSVLHPSQEILNTVEVMALTGFSRASIWRLRKSGQLHTYRVNSRPYYKRSEVIALVDDSLETAKTPHFTRQTA